ncbi:MAG: IS200/IS605 family transposase [Bacteroidetes bacterium]|nr:IS200/IS605 family transposase [Bacteroidota bacterium]MBU1579015.1 IS200/IS605 family transposase [Bacteroidota bacterium]MBU2483262.1 IS200/IS605 family transposase [Pseudomonadota bacterium]MBU2558171.1 IS200/IS605 family transposase [Bacteroidota bacterium]
MSSYRQIYYHIVFNTYYRRNTMPAEHHEELYKYIWGIIKNRKSVLYRINGTENHIHIFSDLHPTVCLADFIKEIKTASNRWMKESGKFPKFEHWAEGYCALTYGDRDKDMIINYIKKQKEHHAKVSFEDEYRKLLEENGIEWDEKYLF